MKIGKIILLVLAAVLIALPLKAFFDLPNSTGRLKEAIYLDAPEALPENEGKLVIIHGVPETLEPVYDSELRLTLNTFKAIRHREIYEQKNSQDDEISFDWVNKGSKILIGKAAIGEFNLSEGILKAFPADGYYTSFDPDETFYYTLDKSMIGAQALYVLPYGGLYVDAIKTLESDSDTAWIKKRNKGLENQGNEAYHYRHYDTEQNSEMTVVGVQKENTLEIDDTLGALVKNGVVAQDKLISSNRVLTILGSGISLVLGLVLVYFGLRKPKKKADAP